MQWKAAGLTDTGQKRQSNEDAFFQDGAMGLFMVADGMGGHAAGEVASKMAVDITCQFVRDFLGEDGMKESNPEKIAEILTGAAQMANDHICNRSAEDARLKGMGTTLSGIFLQRNQGYLFHVGDSRVYRFRKGKLELLTRDHSWVNEQLRQNLITEEEARNHRWRNVITRALGHKGDLDVDTHLVDLEGGDLFLLCSDGLTGMVEDSEIANLLQRDGTDLDEICRALVDAANEAGGNDNITAVLANVED